MNRRTIGGVDVWFGKFGNKYLIIRGKDIYYSDEKPVTDQEIEKYKRELEELREEESRLREELRLRQILEN